MCTAFTSAPAASSALRVLKWLRKLAIISGVRPTTSRASFTPRSAKLDQLAYALSRPRLQNRATVRPVHVRPDDPEGKTAQTRSSAHVVAPACGPGALLTRLLLSSAAAPRSRRKSATASWPQHLRACEPCRHRRLSCRPPFRRPLCPRDRPSPDSHYSISNATFSTLAPGA